MEQSALDALKTKRDQTLNIVKAKAKELSYYRDHGMYLEAQLRKVQKRYELLDRKIFEMEHSERIKSEMIIASKKPKPKTPKAKLKTKIDTILSNMSEDQLKALLAKHL